MVAIIFLISLEIRFLVKYITRNYISILNNSKPKNHESTTSNFHSSSRLLFIWIDPLMPLFQKLTVDNQPTESNEFAGQSWLDDLEVCSLFSFQVQFSLPTAFQGQLVSRARVERAVERTVGINPKCSLTGSGHSALPKKKKQTHHQVNFEEHCGQNIRKAGRQGEGGSDKQ